MKTSAANNLFLALLLVPLMADATTYYVDFLSGNDSYNGLSPSTPFKHSPGDVNAGFTAKTTVLNTGDVIILKGGVKYKGRINVFTSGLTLDGNTSGNFGKGKAIIDGSESFVSWQRCSLPGVAASLYCTDLPSNADPYALNIYENEKRAIIAQSPQPSNYLQTDNLSEYYSVPPANLSSGTINDPNNLSSLSSDWNSAILSLWGGNNRTYFLKIKTFNGNSITYDPTSVTTYTDRPTRYAVLNLPAALDNPGEYYVDVPNKKIYYYPFGNTPQDVTYSLRDIGIGIQANNVTVRGFVVEKQTGGVGQWRKGMGIYAAGISPTNKITGTKIIDNEIRYTLSIEHASAIQTDWADNTLIANNYIHHHHHTRGIRAQY